MYTTWRWLAVGLALFAISISSARGQIQVTGIPADLLAEVSAPAKLPAGAYTLVARWSATQLSHLVGSRATDPEATNGVAWSVEASLDALSGPMLYGPYFDAPAGDYVAFFRLKRTGDIGDETIGAIDACGNQAVDVFASRDLTADDLGTTRYIQVPLAFKSTGGKLECRLHWQSTTSLNSDGVTLFRRVGPPVDTATTMVPQPVSDGTIKNLPYAPPSPPYPSIFPRSSKPSDKLVVCDLRSMPVDVQFLAVTLQGLVNRAQPRLYCIVNAEDPFWLDWMKTSKRVTDTETFNDVFDLVERYRDVVKGVVITDPVLPASRNVATMVAGVMDGVVVSPRLASRLNMPVLADLRGRWKKSYEAYQWAYDTLWDKMDHNVAACLWPTDTGLRDYLVQHRIPVFWMPGRIDGAKPYADAKAELQVVEKMLARMPANVPTMGYPWAGVDIGMGEGPGVGLLAEYGKYLVGSPGCTNISVHSGYPEQQRTQPAAEAPTLRNDKVYYSFLISDGDNLPVIEVGNWPQLWRDKARGSLPFAWTISPSSNILLPDIVDYYYATATPNDTFVAAVSGVGYTYPQLYGKRFRKQTKVFEGFLGQTARTMKAMDLRTINPSGVTAREIALFAEHIPGLKGIFADYGRLVNSYEEATTATSLNIPVFHGVTGWEPKANREEQIAGMVKQIKGITPAAKPAFMHVFVCNWFYDLPALQEVQRRLGPNYVPVSPENLATLCRMDMEREAIHLAMAPTLGGIKGRRAALVVPIRNVTSHPFTITLSVNPAGGMSVAPKSVYVKSAQEVNATIVGIPKLNRIDLSIKGPFGRRSFSTSLLQTPPNEIIGAPPSAPSAYLVTFEAEGLSHNVGEEMEDATASGGRARTAVKGKTQPGHIIFGPYRSFPAGRYVALFRVKRTGEGVGSACVLDATVAGAPQSLAMRTVDAKELPMGEWRSVAVHFTHPGGSLETRAFWPGNASLAVDRVDLYRVGK